MKFDAKSIIALSLLGVGVFCVSQSFAGQAIKDNEVSAKATLSSLSSSTASHAYAASCSCPFCSKQSSTTTSSVLDILATF